MLHSSTNRRIVLKTLFGTAAGTAIFSGTANGQRPAENEEFTDERLTKLKDLNGYFPFQVPETTAAWEQRRQDLKDRTLLACGLWPMPSRPPIEAAVHGRIARDGYTIDRVYFESSPGLFVTGSLYRPEGVTGPLPTILCPHGHWSDGRFHDHGDGGIREELASGAEVDPVGGRHPLQARCVQLARMGCMVFLYDMLGYADGGGMSYELIHRFAEQRPHLSSPERWGLFSAQSELRLWNALGLQTWNSIRTLDWITTLPDCDSARLGVTGASGGGTQTFLLAAIDDRIRAAFPAVMVSTAMQGGCTCENATYLRVDSGNIELAALIAPRPLAMSGANDWTVDIETKGFPELRQLYALLGYPDHVSARHFDFPHNYNRHSRRMMYEFFREHFRLEGSPEESAYQPVRNEEATVFGANHPAPEVSEETETRILQALDADLTVQIDRSMQSATQWDAVAGRAWKLIVGRSLPATGACRWVDEEERNTDYGMWFDGSIEFEEKKERIPASFGYPKKWNGNVVIWLTNNGRSALAEGSRPEAVDAQLRSGNVVLAPDLLGLGKASPGNEPLSEAPVVPNPREFAGYTLGYNAPLPVRRAHDLLSLLATLRDYDPAPQRIHLYAEGALAAVAALAANVAGESIDTTTLLFQGFNYEEVTDVRSPDLLPGAVRYGGVNGLIAGCRSKAVETDFVVSDSCRNVLSQAGVSLKQM